MQLERSIIEILNNRGISAAEDVAEFLSDKPQRTYDPFLLKDMEAGVDLVLSAIDEGRRICVYGDYDADGVTSVALLKDVLTALGGQVTYYIPSRFDEGYGLNSAALDKIKAAGVSLLITVDCGCTSAAEARHAKEIGLDILITDHHAMREERPDCLLIDPQQKDCPYPFKFLAGVGVAFKLAQALCETAGLPKQVLTRNLDLVGIGTIGDIVPLVDENRTLAKYGLRAMNLSRRPGLRALIEGIGLHQGEIDSGKVSFGIVPHINAAGRMGDAALAARLMLTEDEARAQELTARLKECNDRRKRIQDGIYRDCLDIIHRDGEPGRFLLVELTEAHEGVTGIVAGKLKETFYLPSLVVTDIEDGLCKGTGRSIDTINIFEILNRRADLFERFGGHAAACGFTIKKENVPALRAHLAAATAELPEEAFRRQIKADAVMEGREVTPAFTAQQKLLEPFGKGNPRPKVAVRLMPGRVNRMGNAGQYLSFGGSLDNGASIRGVDFKRADETEPALQKAAAEGRFLRLIGEIEEQTWKDRTYVQINLAGVEGEES